MTRNDLTRLLLLAALWGGSFIFIRVAVSALGPIATVAGRVLIAGVTLLFYAAVTKIPLGLRARWRQYLAIGILNSALPFLLISTAELYLSASMAAILNATSPLFGGLFSALWLKDPLTGRKISGIAIAITGVVILVGWSPLTFSNAVVLSIGASLLAAMCYGLAGTYTRAKVRGAPPLGMAVGSQLSASLLLAPFVPFAWPHVAPSLAVMLCLLALALLSTAVGYILYFRLIVDVGPTRALTVTFLTPIFGLLWGALFLREAITPAKLVGCGVVLVGASLVTGIRANLFPAKASAAAEHS